jgi:hypothetical protein
LEHSWEPQAAVVWLAALGLATLAVVRVLGSSLEKGGGGLTTLVRLVVLGGIALLLGLSDSLRLAQLAGGLTCAVAVVDLVVLRGRARWDRADALVVTISLGGLMLTSYFYAGLDPWSAGLAVLALLALGLSHSESRWLQLAPLVPILLALALSLVSLLSAGDPYDDYYAALTPSDLGTTTINTR